VPEVSGKGDADGDGKFVKLGGVSKEFGKDVAAFDGRDKGKGVILDKKGGVGVLDDGGGAEEVGVFDERGGKISDK
jgi:hypothetical protein